MRAIIATRSRPAFGLTGTYESRTVVTTVKSVRNHTGGIHGNGDRTGTGLNPVNHYAGSLFSPVILAVTIVTIVTIACLFSDWMRGFFQFRSCGGDGEHSMVVGITTLAHQKTGSRIILTTGSMIYACNACRRRNDDTARQPVINCFSQLPAGWPDVTCLWLLYSCESDFWRQTGQAASKPLGTAVPSLQTKLPNQRRTYGTSSPASVVLIVWNGSRGGV